MLDQLDHDLRDAVERRAAVAGASPTWEAITTGAGRGSDDRHSSTRLRLGLAIAASLVLVVAIAAIAQVRTGGDPEDADDPPSGESLPPVAPSSPDDRVPVDLVEIVGTEVTLLPLTSLDAESVAVASVAPAGWVAEPTVLLNGGMFTTSKLRAPDGASTIAWFELPSVGPGVGEQLTIDGVTWSIVRDDGRTIASADLGASALEVSTSTVVEDDLVEVLRGLRAAPIADAPAGVFDPLKDGEVVAADPGGLTLTATSDASGTTCWALRWEPGSFAQQAQGGCRGDLLADEAQTSIELADGIVLLELGGEGRSANAVDENAPIVETRIDLAGVVRGDIGAVDVQLDNGTTVTVETQDRTGSFDVRFFVVSFTVDGDAFGGGNGVRSVTATEPFDAEAGDLVDQTDG